MPQMSPMNWLMLYFFTLFIIYMFISINYFNFEFTSKYKKSHYFLEYPMLIILKKMKNDK